MKHIRGCDFRFSPLTVASMGQWDSCVAQSKFQNSHKLCITIQYPDGAGWFDVNAKRKHPVHFYPAQNLQEATDAAGEGRVLWVPWGSVSGLSVAALLQQLIKPDLIEWADVQQKHFGADVHEATIVSTAARRFLSTERIQDAYWLRRRATTLEVMRRDDRYAASLPFHPLQALPFDFLAQVAVTDGGTHKLAVLYETDHPTDLGDHVGLLDACTQYDVPVLGFREIQELDAMTPFPTNNLVLQQVAREGNLVWRTFQT